MSFWLWIDGGIQNALFAGVSLILVVVSLYAAYRGWQSYAEGGLLSTIMLFLGAIGVVGSLFLMVFFGWRFIVPPAARDYLLDAKGSRIAPGDFSELRPVNKDPNWFYKQYKKLIELPDNKLYAEVGNGRRVPVVRVYRDLYKDSEGNYFRCQKGNCLETIDRAFIEDRSIMAERSNIKEVVRGAPFPGDPMYRYPLERNSIIGPGNIAPFQLRPPPKN